ncbi:MAG TPA: cobyric acid synthase [Candidatus Methanomethylophilaceae archaeon]|nr:cobyric acid synthase [Candidatus Methanomethylophilaceae archaeon]
MRILFLGTASGAGKTTVAAMYCRYLSRSGISVAPFKGSNLSLSSYKLQDGEIGIGQAFQALASGTEPETDMNPILLKPMGEGRIRLYLNGKQNSEVSHENPMDVEMATVEACEAFDRLSRKYDAVVCEGSGSPAEINMRDRDIANIGMMRERNIPAVLVGDIERGGVFAALYGTWKLIPDGQRGLLKGFIINRFRGDSSILGSGIERIEELTGMRCLGILPYANLKFPEEDSLSDNNGEGTDEEYIDNLDSMIRNAEDSGFDFKTLREIAEN